MAATGNKQIAHLLGNQCAIADVVGFGLEAGAGEGFVESGFGRVDVEEPATGGDGVIVPRRLLQIFERECVLADDAVAGPPKLDTLGC